MFVLSKSNLATAVDGVWIDNLVVRLFTLSFCLNAFSAKSESVGKKSMNKRGAALRMLAYASIWPRMS